MPVSAIRREWRVSTGSDRALPRDGPNRRPASRTRALKRIDRWRVDRDRSQFRHRLHLLHARPQTSVSLPIPASTPAFRWKVALLGDHGVGKTSLLRRYVHDIFSDAYLATLGAKVMWKDVKLETFEPACRMVLWDIHGAPWLREQLLEAYLRGARGALLVYDVTRSRTLEHLEDYWIPALLRIAGPVPAVSLGILANKIDKSRYPEDEEVILTDLTREYPKLGLVTSAKTGQGVEESFKRLAEAMLEAVILEQGPHPRWVMREGSGVGDDVRE